MKHSKRIPRRVAGSLLYSLYSISERLQHAISYANSLHTQLPEEFDAVNRKLLKVSDTSVVEAISEFWTAICTKANRKKITDDAFMTIAKHSDLRVRYVAEDTSMGLVITTGCLKRLLELSANIVDRQEWVDNKTYRGVYVCDTSSRNQRYVTAHCPHFLRILDIIRYMEETETDMLEISMKNIGRDLENLKELGGYGYGGGCTELSISKQYPFMSDRYQPESWKHYLTTLYAGMVNEVNIKVPVATPMNRDIALSELNIK